MNLFLRRSTAVYKANERGERPIAGIAFYHNTILKEQKSRVAGDTISLTGDLVLGTINLNNESRYTTSYSKSTKERVIYNINSGLLTFG